MLLSLLEAIVDREADVLERADREIDTLSRQVFRRHGAKPTRPGEFQETLEEIGETAYAASALSNASESFSVSSPI